ncbi:MotA/TolQ/ExbB proton channel family protein [Biformimicrobium ophioploci]|uniref:MotA/TolQ/ExbB proton channel family protein n=1 Tax=Biformimicrobium ophioploci TaxID=3036711 RepID=A0ABQ6M152_9GAMM|nr:MotA/TolQ/ExbB proton channel family protein [Microbulbifer sp. NKW57]GMG88090.1 MotA/TolQ/ExbB proton channel family protein [Microbulbifer sp. NKW57]
MNTILRFFQDGGLFMYPIALVLVIGLAIVIERWIFLNASQRKNRRAYEAIMPMLQKKNFSGVLKVARDDTSSMSAVLASGVESMQYSRRREDIEHVMEEGVMESMTRLEKRTGYLATLANIATLLGLLGTIIGLIAAFTAVANADPTEKASLLSASISVAMNTTAFGLTSAIPLLLFHTMLQTKTNEIVDGLEMAGVKCLNLLSRIGAATSNAAPAPSGATATA